MQLGTHHRVNYPCEPWLCKRFARQVREIPVHSCALRSTASGCSVRLQEPAARWQNQVRGVAVLLMLANADPFGNSHSRLAFQRLSQVA